MDLPVLYNDIPIEDRRIVREEYIRRQSGKCYHCGAPLSDPPTVEMALRYVDESLFPEKFFVWPVHLHHSHMSGLTVGAVHARCNAILWQYYRE